MEAADQTRALTIDALGSLLELLVADGYTLVGPTVRDGAIVLDRIAGVGDLPAGVGDEQAPGHYRLRKRSDGALFGWAVGAHAPKRELFVPRTPLVQIRRRAGGLSFSEPKRTVPRLALIGVRPCEVAGILVQDRVLAGATPDPDYVARRQGAFILTVHCTEPSGTCFCDSMGTGPRARTGFDLAATELVGPPHRFVVEAGSERGEALLVRAGLRAAPSSDVAAAASATESARAKMGRTLRTEGLKERLQNNLEHPRWDDVASRCLGCTSCTMVCPTCFCSTIEDTTSLDGEEATRTRRWDSCFSTEFSYVHGGTVRPSLKARYRQWLTHKLAGWHDQFDESGCVGCGRCITWCPVGIDITQEAEAVGAEPSGA